MDIRFDEVSLTYADGTKALDRVSLVVPAGQICVVLGPSGAGKSTLLRCVTGLSLPDRGRVELGGTQVSPPTLNKLRRRTGMIHQDFGLASRASVATNMMGGAATEMSWWRAMMGLYPRHLRERAAALMQAVGLEEPHLHRRVDRLSGGQQQRAGVARAFMRDPSIVLADEPVASLDPGSGAAVLDLIRTHAQSGGATVLCSLHQLDLARGFADRIVAMRGGRIVFDGAPNLLDERQAERLYSPRLDVAA